MKFRPLRWLARLGLAVLALVIALVGILLMIEWRPDPLEDTPVQPGRDTPAQPPAAGAELGLVSWNLGYAGLDAKADFFMDGGKQVRPPDRDRVEANLEAMATWLAGQPADVVLLQEVDFDSSRTWGMDQSRVIGAALPTHFQARALNFKVAYVPYPLSEPLGRMNSGLVSLTRARPGKATRHQLPGDYAWPVRVFHLKRCLHELRLPAPDGKDWVLLHLHLSAFDKGGELRTQQMDYLRRLMQLLYAEGHHVIVAGDWNHAPPGLAVDHFPHTAETPFWLQQVPAGWTPKGWTWAWDPQVPSLRATDAPFQPGRSFLTTVDSLLLGPDVELVQVETVDLGFAHTDHQPVVARVRLKPGPR